MSDQYIPIPCPFYDMLEEAAVLKKECSIIYSEGEEEKTICGKIVDFKTANKEEFLMMDDGTSIRLDKIKDLNGVDPSSFSSCSF